MKLFFRGLLSSLLFLAVVAKAGVQDSATKTRKEDEAVGLLHPVIPLKGDLTLRLSRENPHLEVDTKGYISFFLKIPALGEDFFNRHHLQINVPYFSNGYKKNHYIEVSQRELDEKDGLVLVKIPSEEPAGTPIYLHNGERRFTQSTAEWLARPIIQFLIARQMLKHVGSVGETPFHAPSIDFTNGAFLEGTMGYIILDSSLRFARDTREHLEVYYQMEPGASSMTVVAIFSAGAFLLSGVPIDPEHFTALSMQKSFVYSVTAGGMVDTADEHLLTPKIAEKWFPTHGSVRNFKSKLASQAIRGPIFSAGLSQLDFMIDGTLGSVSPAQRLLTHKLMIKSATEARQFNELVGQSVGGVPGRIAELGMNGATVTFTGVDGPSGSLKQTFVGEFHQQLGSHAHKQVREVKNSVFSGETLTHLGQVISQVGMDFLIGGLMYSAAHEIDLKVGGSGMVSNRIGKGIGLSYATKTLGSCVVEWVTGCATELAHNFLAKSYPNAASYFRRDYLVEINHGLVPEPEPKQALGSRSHAFHDEL